MTKITQQTMFPQGQDLPLFSETCPQVPWEPFRKKIAPRQSKIFACQLCNDTGLLQKDAGYLTSGDICSCPAGDHRLNQIQMISAVSSGTLSYLLNKKNGVLIDAVQQQWILWLKNHPAPNFATWRDAWDQFHLTLAETGE